MGKSLPMPGFGEVELEVSSETSGAGFGKLDDWEFADDEAVSGETAIPSSHARITPAPHPATHEDSTRIVKGDALAEMARSTMPPPIEVELREKTGKPFIRRHDSSSTRQASLDGDLLAVARGEDGPASTRSSSRQAPSGSGVSPKDQRVAEMRELYARGDADAALALAASINEEVTQAAAEEEANSVDIESFEDLNGGDELEVVDDPWGGLVPVEDEEEAPLSLDPAVASLSLTERQGILRVKKSREEIATLPIDHRAGFLLAFIDGNQTLEEILDICAMPTTDALGLIETLKSLGVIELD